jgi:signal transduction histidine kinase
VQEDFLPTLKFGSALHQAVELMRRDAKWDLVQFFANFQYPYTRLYQGDFSAITILPFALDYHKSYSYSDNRHLRRTTFPTKFGPYRKDLPGYRTEYRMCISFIQKYGQALLHNDFQNLQLICTKTDLDTFIYTASHDLRTPIASIEGLLTALSDQLPAAALQAELVEQMLDRMQGAVERFQLTIT